MDEEIEESPYCEICGHCGEIGCCGIVNFLEEHVKDKTNCKNEGWVIKDIISICNYQTDVFKENNTLNKGIDELIKKYEEEFQKLGQDGFGYEEEKYGKWLITEKIIQDLKKLKGE